MRCLHCGSTLSAFKKLTDADFCSAEHRDAFYTEQQRLIVARLKQAADRYHRLRQPSKTADPVIAAVTAAPLPTDAQAPAPLGKFLAAKLEAHARAISLAFLPAVEWEQRPAYGSTVLNIILEQRFCPLLPDLPWPRYNPGLQFLSDLLLDATSSVRSRLAGLESQSFVSSFAFSAAAGLMVPRRPDIASPPTAAIATVALRMAKPKARVALGRVRFAVSKSALGMDGCGFERLPAVGPSEPSPLASFFDVSPIAVIATSGIPASLRLSASPGAKALSFLDRIYRMRPRFGVTSADVPAIRRINLEPLPATAVSVRPSRMEDKTSTTSAATGTPDFATGTFQKDVRLAGVDSPGLASFCGEPGALGSNLAPAFPASESASMPEPVPIERLFRPRPKPVLASTLETAGKELAAETPWSCVPQFPGTEPTSGPAPRPVERFYRPRPKGPVDASLAAFQPNNLEALQTAGGPSIGTLPTPALSVGIATTAPLFQARPRSGVASASDADLTATFRPETLLSKPATPPSEGFCDAAPSPVTRMFRMRPRAGVDAPSSTIHPPQLTSYPFTAREVSNPATSSPGLPVTGVAFVDRLYRGRPRNPVPSATREFLAAQAGDAIAGTPPEPSRPTLYAAAPALEPARSERMFRARPRNGVPDATLSASLASSSNAEPLLSAPAKPAFSLLPCEPVLVDRLFRMRPRTGVGSETASLLEQVSAKPENLTAAIAKPVSNLSLGQEFSLRQVDRMYRGRPRAGIAAAVGQSTSVPTAALVFPAEPKAVTQALSDCAPASIQKLFRFRPKSGVDSNCPMEFLEIASLAFSPAKPEFVPDWYDVLQGARPHFVNKMYRMRMKQPAQDPETVTRPIRTKHLAAAEPEPVLATLPAPASAASPSFLDRLYRMRPRGGKSTLPAANPIPCEAIEPRAMAGVPAAVLQSISKQWKAAPFRVKSIAATLPILLLLAAIPWTAPTRAAENPLRQAMSRRAAIDRSADFRDGLAQWPGAEQWKRTASGAIQPVGLALFQPSLKMTDYRFSFSTQVHKGGVGFVVRATDDRNYQAIKLKVVKGGPLPVVRVVRWAVIDGREANRNEIPLPLTVTADTQYRVALEVNDRSFTLMVQDKVVDFWSEEQLKSGGAGFFGDKGERASIHNVRMTHQDDAVGKLFAALTLRERSSD